MKESASDGFENDAYNHYKDCFDRDTFKADISQSEEKIKNQLDQTLVMAFVGTASCGKTTAIKQIFNVDLGSIHPSPGSTQDMKILSIDSQVSVIDLPGFGDINQARSQKAYDACKQADLFIYVINSQGGGKIQEQQDYSALLSYGREILVVLNKIDTIMDPRNPHQLQDFINFTKDKIGVSNDNFIASAFDPMREVSSKPINLEPIALWIHKKLKIMKKDVLFTKLSRFRDKLCDKEIKDCSKAAFGLGAVPVPGSDIVNLSALQLHMIMKIGRIYGRQVSSRDAIKFITQTIVGQSGKQIYRYILNALKTSGYIPGNQLSLIVVGTLAGSLAASLTYGLGQTAKYFYKNDGNTPLDQLQERFKDAYDSTRTV